MFTTTFWDIDVSNLDDLLDAIEILFERRPSESRLYNRWLELRITEGVREYIGMAIDELNTKLLQLADRTLNLGTFKIVLKTMIALVKSKYPNHMLLTQEGDLSIVLQYAYKHYDNGTDEKDEYPFEDGIVYSKMYDMWKIVYNSFPFVLFNFLYVKFKTLSLYIKSLNSSETELLSLLQYRRGRLLFFMKVAVNIDNGRHSDLAETNPQQWQTFVDMSTEYKKLWIRLAGVPLQKFAAGISLPEDLENSIYGMIDMTDVAYVKQERGWGSHPFMTELQDFTFETDALQRLDWKYPNDLTLEQLREISKRNDKRTLNSDADLMQMLEKQETPAGCVIF